MNSAFKKDISTSALESRGIMFTPPVGEDYWLFRVKLSSKQSVIGFPKFGTIGVGFSLEEDWNTNLPYSSDTNEIYNHIKHNKGDKSIHHTKVKKAIALIRDAATLYMKQK